MAVNDLVSSFLSQQFIPIPYVALCDKYIYFVNIRRSFGHCSTSKRNGISR